MDIIDEIEKLQLEDSIKEFVSLLNIEYRFSLLSKEQILIMQDKLDMFLNNLSKDFIYDYDVYTDGLNVKFKFDIKRRSLYGFLG